MPSRLGRHNQLITGVGVRLVFNNATIGINLHTALEYKTSLHNMYKWV